MSGKHPRIRGENSAGSFLVKKAMETSPHTRGEPYFDKLLERSDRNIPAYAGRTKDRSRNLRRREKHPRIRGENPSSFDQLNDKLETSPHTRGELGRFVEAITYIGNIPAYAGRTSIRRRLFLFLRKHPRIRGENGIALDGSKVIAETSPHTRGEQDDHDKASRSQGNIPAYAGRTSHFGVISPDARKHPRIRGENNATMALRALAPETSPHTRGEPSAGR